MYKTIQGTFPIQYEECSFKYRLVQTGSIFTSCLPPSKKIKSEFVKFEKAIPPREGLLTISSGFCWDGPSGPTIDTDTFMLGALAHDALYYLIREGKLPMSYRKLADKELFLLCRARGMSAFRASYVYQAVRLFGRSSAIKKNT